MYVSRSVAMFVFGVSMTCEPGGSQLLRSAMGRTLREGERQGTLISLKLRQSEVSLISFSTLSLFYILYLTYLALSSLQLKYVHVMRGGLRFCHSTDIGRMLIFKVLLGKIAFLGSLVSRFSSPHAIHPQLLGHIGRTL